MYRKGCSRLPSEPSAGNVGRPLADCFNQVSPRILIPHQATFHRTGLFEERGRFNESFLIGGDYDFLLRELKKRDALFLDDIVVKAVTSGGLSTNLGLKLDFGERKWRVHSD